MADKKNEIAEEMPEESLEDREILRWKSPLDCIRRVWKC